jgi:hypothetical protein
VDTPVAVGLAVTAGGITAHAALHWASTHKLLVFWIVLGVLAGGCTHLWQQLQKPEAPSAPVHSPAGDRR